MTDHNESDGHGCPVGHDPASRGIPRREFVKSAVAIGGAGALAACLERERPGTPTAASPEFPRGPDDPSSLPARQHAWSNYLVHDAHGNTVLPGHQVLLLLDYGGSVPPTDDERAAVESALRTVERAFERGTGGDPETPINEGLLSMLGYAPTYFDRFDDPLPPSVDLPPPREVLSTLGEDPAAADPYDALLLLTSDFGSVVLAAEEALFGERDRVNGVAIEATLSGVFERAERRTGFVGKGLPARRLDQEGIPEHAPLSMGYKSGFGDNLASEDRVTINEGPFAAGTTLLLSRLTIDLARWYDRDEPTRAHQMFSPAHSVDDVGQTGEPLGADSGITEEIVDAIDEHAERHGRLGHTQKTARARDDGFEPRILRRSEGVATDVDEPGVAAFNFSSVQRGMEEFVVTRRAMDPDEYDVDVAPGDHGIVDFLTTERRATFLVPPRGLRALPPPRPGAAGP